uniref:USP domain-containing protein n=1 Tax=Caenorhabditis tropicalis TaxID=1561998 RepID=A0A1I7U3B4_9PELO
MANVNTNQVNEWRFTGSLNIQTSRDHPVSCLKFDSHEEILWVGSTTGRVSALLPTNQFSRYSAFIASQNSPVHALEPTENVIFSLTNTTLRASSKQGVPLANYTSHSMTNLSAMCHLPGSSTFLMGGYQCKLIQYDFSKEKEIRTSDLVDKEIAFMIKYNGSNIFTADKDGKIHIRNAKNFEKFKHSHAIWTSSIFSRGQNNDKFIKVFDLRMYKVLKPMSSLLNPRFARFMPSYCERVCSVYQAGHPQSLSLPWNLYPAGIRMFDTDSDGNSVEFPVDTSLLTAFDYSSSRNFIALGNHSGIINLFADRDHPSINENSKETIFAAPPVQPPLSFAIDDTSQTFGSIPIGFSPEPLLSDWPIECTAIVHRRRKPPTEQTNVKSIHYAVQIKNPRVNTKLKRHNIVPYFLEDTVIESTEEQKTTDERPQAIVKTKVSKLYKKRPPPPIQINRRANNIDETLETYTWNVIRHVTMQSTFSMNLVANSVVQVLYSISSLRNIIIRHICTKNSCITCELHFLFTAFSSKIGQTTGITTTNLAWALARNGISLKTGGLLSAMNQIIKTTLNDVADKDLATTISSKFDRHFCCVRCRGLQTIEQDSDHLLTLRYGSIHQASLCQLIEKALHLGPESGERECEDCKQMSRMECKRKIRELSPVLLINTNPSADEFVDFWRRQLTVFERRPVSQNAILGNVPPSPSEKKICRYGIDCRHKKTCKYIHGCIDWSSEQQKLLDEVDMDGWNHYIPSRIAAQLCEGIVRISDISDVPGYDEPNAIIYELEAMVHVIGNGEPSANWTHPVTLLKESPVASTAWTLINEQLVSRLHDHEARHVDARWKLPALLSYKQKGLEAKMNGQDIPDELFFAEENVANNETVSVAIKSMDELPKKEELVGLDAEFIKIKTDLLEFNGKFVQMRAVGRASCVDAAGEKIIFDDYVQLDDDVEVVDYLTKFSGIVAADLSSTSSDKYLTTHKRLLLRMHVMIQRGVIFVGHALHNDFSVLNVHVTEPQIIDTVVLLRLETQRMLSLQFLVKEILGEIIQSAEHDSVVDARYALKLYRRYMQINDQGTLGSEMRRIYANLPCNSPNHTASPLVVSTFSKTPDGTTEAAPKSI